MVKDIGNSSAADAPRKRIRAHLKEADLRNLASPHPFKLDQLLAAAHFRAEEMRAASKGSKAQ